MDFRKGLYKRARAAKATIILAEADDPRVRKAAAIILKERLAKLLLLTDKKVPKPLQAVSYGSHPMRDRLAESLAAARAPKGMTLTQAREELAKNPVMLAAILVREGEADGYVAGNLSATADSVRPALQLLREGFASSHFIIIHKGRVLLFADCGFNIDPSSEELVLIAQQTVMSALRYGLKPKVAFLSFSTKGSGHGERVEKVRRATSNAKECLSIPVDGELQFDAAFVPAIAKRKAKGSPVAGSANVFLFPDLDSGNIAYKIAQHLAGAQVIGPVLQGLRKPVNDLSRGCSVQEIVDAVAITALQVVR